MRRRFRSIALRSFAILALIYLIAPLAVVIPLSLTDQRMLSLPVHGISFSHYQSVLQSPEWLHSAAQSVVVGVLATATALIAGTCSAIGCWMIGGAGFFRVISLLPIVIPSIIYALGAYRFFAAVGLLDTLLGVVLVHAVGAIPFVFVAVSANLEYVDPGLVRAARSLGAGLVRTAVGIVLPNIRTGLISATVFAFLHSWDEVVVTLFVSGRNLHTLPLKMWEGLTENLDPAIACVGVGLIFLTLLLLSLEQRAHSRNALKAEIV